MVTTRGQENLSSYSSQQLLQDFQSASTKEETLNVLTRLQQAINNDSAIIKTVFSPKLLSELLQCCSNNRADSSSLDIVCDIVERIFLTVSRETVIRTCCPEISQSLQSCPSELRNIILSNIKKALDASHDTAKDELILHLLQNEILLHCLRLLGAHEDGALSCLPDTKGILIASGLALLREQSLVAQMKELLKKEGSVVRFRVHEVVVGMAVKDGAYECFKQLNELSFLKALLTEYDSSDVLAQLNCLELLTDFAMGPSFSVKYLYESQFLDKLSDVLKTGSDSMEGSLLYPALYPSEVDSAYPEFLASVKRMAASYSSLSEAEKLLAFDTLGVFGTLLPGKEILASKYIDVMMNFATALKHGNDQLKPRHLQALKTIVTQDESAVNHSAGEKNESTSCAETVSKLLHGMGPDPLGLLLTLFQSPFPDVRVAAGEVFTRLCVYHFVQEALKTQPGFLEYLLNRDTETQMEGRHVKFEIVKTLVNSAKLKDIFDAGQVRQLEEFVAKGVYYVKGVQEVATEEV